MMRQKLVLVAVAAAATTGAAYAAAYDRSPHWTPGVRWHYDTTTSTRFLFMRQLGTQTTTGTDTGDDTRQIAFDTYGLHVVTRTAPWRSMPVRWVPRNAKVVRLMIQTVISRGPSQGNAVVYGFVRTPGSTCCVGPPGLLDYPVDYSYPGNVWHEGEAAHGVVTEPGGEVREWSTIDVAVKDRRFQFSWGYRKMPDDAVGLGVYLAGYAD